MAQTNDCNIALNGYVDSPAGIGREPGHAAASEGGNSKCTGKAVTSLLARQFAANAKAGSQRVEPRHESSLAVLARLNDSDYCYKYCARPIPADARRADRGIYEYLERLWTLFFSLE